MLTCDRTDTDLADLMPDDDGYENITVISPMKQYARHVQFAPPIHSLIVLDGFFPMFEGCKHK